VSEDEIVDLIRGEHEGVQVDLADGIHDCIVLLVERKTDVSRVHPLLVVLESITNP
jgi:hypothetical protein